MRLFLSILPLTTLLAGCAATVAGQSGSGAAITPYLARYGLDSRQSRCVAERLGARLTPAQLRRLVEAADPETAPASGVLSVRDLMRVASSISDSQIGVEVARAAGGCAVLPDIAVRRSGAGTGPSGRAASIPSRAPVWLNLGRAPTGQSIAVDGSSLEQEASFRKGWFRLTNPGATSPTGASYLLRIDCAGRTIQSLAQRSGVDPGVTSEPELSESPAPVEGGTVMEIAYLALCT